MKHSYIECDFCGARHTIEPITVGGYAKDWIEVRMSVGGSGHKLETGLSHFCLEECLLSKLSGKRKERLPK